MKSKNLVEVMALMATSPMYRGWTVADIGNRILPPLALDQFVLQHDDNGRPVAFGTWAFLTREAQKGFRYRTRNLVAGDWNAGRIPWGIDIIALENPRRLIDAMRAKLAADGHDGKVIKFLRFKPGGVREGRGKI